MVLQVRLGPQQVSAAHQLVESPAAERCHDAASVLSDHEEVVDEVLRLPRELFPQLRVLRGNAHGASVEVALPHHDATQRDERGGRQRHLLGPEQRGNDDVAAGAELTVGLHGDAVPEAVKNQSLVSLRDADLPRKPGVLDGAPLGGSGAARHARNGEVVSLALDDARGDDADAHARHELHGDARLSVRVLQVHDELRHILDGVHVVVRRRRNEADAGRGLARFGDNADDLVAGELAALAGLRPLRELDLQLVSIRQVLRRDAEAARGHLLDLGANGIALKNIPGGAAHLDLALLQRLEALGFLAALARVAPAADAIHRNRHGAVRLVGNGTQGGGAGAEAFDDFRRGLDLIDRHGLDLLGVEVELPTDLGVLRELVLPSGEELVGLGGIRLRRLLQLVDDVGGVHVHLRLVDGAEVVLAQVIQLFDLLVHKGRQVPAWRVRELVKLHGVLREGVEAHAVEDGLAVGEALGHDLLADADGLEELRALVTLQAGDPHLGHHLQDAELRGMAEVLDALVQRQIAPADPEEAEVA
mmetsp:Transcript_74396/g.215038  ORF Transcript_74396/g.215038 Transcript_74396/m.215038 type:complete len:532 (+) Transcript_74396:2125-3720(+)